MAISSALNAFALTLAQDIVENRCKGKLICAGGDDVMALVAVEIVVLLANGWACPLTAVAARHIDDRRDNFDIFLPPWLARHNKRVFGTLFLLGVAFTVLRWWWRPAVG